MMLLFQYLHETVWFLDNLPEEDYTEDDGNTEMKRRSGYIKKCKESIWKRWNTEICEQ